MSNKGKDRPRRSARAWCGVVMLLGLAACAGMDRSCTSWSATHLGADWVVVQNGADGTPYHCWELHGASIANEEHSDGIYWLDETTGNLVHIAGQYSRVQVIGGHWDKGFASLGLTRAACTAVREGVRP